MNIVNLPIAEIKPYENNPRRNDAAVEYVANSIREFGFKVPIIIDRDNVIVAGHTRWLAAQKLGMTEVPCVIADDLSPKQVKAFRLADNKVSEKSSWDYGKLGDEIKELLDIDLGFSLTDIGFGEFEISALTGDFTPNGFDDEVIEQYSKNERELLEKKRVIITYTDENEADIKNMLGVEEIKKIIYDISELL